MYTGFVAQEVEAAARKLNDDCSGVYQPQGDKDAYGLSYSVCYNVPQGLHTAQIGVYDAAGKAPKQINISGQGRGTVNLDAITLPSGTYHYALYVRGKVVDTQKNDAYKIND